MARENGDDDGQVLPRLRHSDLGANQPHSRRQAKTIEQDQDESPKSHHLGQKTESGGGE